MLTPATRASRRSAPFVRRANASATQVRGPPFLNLLPLAEAMTTGLVALGVSTVGPRACAAACFVAASVAPAAAPVLTKSRRLIPRFMAPPGGDGSGKAGRDQSSSK